MSKKKSGRTSLSERVDSPTVTYKLLLSERQLTYINRVANLYEQSAPETIRLMLAFLMVLDSPKALGILGFNVPIMQHIDGLVVTTFLEFFNAVKNNPDIKQAINAMDEDQEDLWAKLSKQ